MEEGSPARLSRASATAHGPITLAWEPAAPGTSSSWGSRPCGLLHVCQGLGVRTRCPGSREGHTSWGLGFIWTLETGIAACGT